MRVVPRVLHYVAQLHSQELFLVTAAVLAFGAAMVSAMLGLSPALGAFLAGLVLSETECDHRVIAGSRAAARPVRHALFRFHRHVDRRAFHPQQLPAVLGMAHFVMAAKALSTGPWSCAFSSRSQTAAFTSLAYDSNRRTQLM
jgi:CPA2 family monovalent cation:H+ antiporter-2